MRLNPRQRLLDLWSYYARFCYAADQDQWRWGGRRPSSGIDEHGNPVFSSHSYFTTLAADEAMTPEQLEYEVVDAYILAAEGLVFGRRGLIEGGVERGHDREALRKSLRYARSAVGRRWRTAGRWKPSWRSPRASTTRRCGRTGDRGHRRREDYNVSPSAGLEGGVSQACSVRCSLLNDRRDG